MKITLAKLLHIGTFRVKLGIDKILFVVPISMLSGMKYLRDDASIEYK